ncbi:hypothetical protein J5N97_020713 [Dioscorea zingiberensis]|uniref:ABC transmembrane type-1 domain-containing protein n=1 Tax=Dioscorea zingiberensis TaxID=325984 RepID=A0A9D5HDP6_9LILI|nr:hypothetical protein J5N97_020713 [Dioscorea zingiberensis]
MGRGDDEYHCSYNNWLLLPCKQGVIESTTDRSTPLSETCLKPSVITYTTLIDGCLKIKNFARTFDLLNTICSLLRHCKNQLSISTMSSIRTVESFTRETHSVNKYSSSLRGAYNAAFQEGLAAGLSFNTATCVGVCGYGLGIAYGSKLPLNNNYSGRDIITVIFATLTGSLSLGQASNCLGSFAARQAVVFKKFEAINRKICIDAYVTTRKKLNDIQGNIDFRKQIGLVNSEHKAYCSIGDT